jgi:hypothetical protein
MVGMVVLLLASLALGVILGEFFIFHFIRKVMPPAAMGQVSMDWIHTSSIFRGLGIGVLFFVWGLIASSITRLFQRRS